MVRPFTNGGSWGFGLLLARSLNVADQKFAALDDQSYANGGKGRPEFPLESNARFLGDRLDDVRASSERHQGLTW